MIRPPHKKILQIIAVFAFCGIGLFFPLKAHASIILSEIYPAPITGESEWVEIFNTGPDSINVHSWILKDQLSTPSIIFTFTDQTLSPGSYFVAELPSAKLNNTSDGVTLFDENGQTIDTMNYTQTESAKSWQRTSVSSPSYVITSPTKVSQNPSYVFQFTQPSSSPTPAPTSSPGPTASPQPTASPDSGSPSPTPGTSPTPTTTPVISPTSTPQPSPSPTVSPSASPLPSPSTTPLPTSAPTPSPTATPAPDYSKIQLSEIMACPSSSSEWIELFNSGTSTVEIKNWKITDESGNVKLLTETIPAQGWQAFYWTGSLLNNAGDSFTITSETGAVIAQADYQNCTVGFSLVFSEAGSTKNWVAAVATPGEKNNSPISENEESSTASTASATPKSTQPIVTAAKKSATAISSTVKDVVSSAGQVLGKYISAPLGKVFTPPPFSLTEAASESGHRSSIFTTKDSNIPGKQFFASVVGGLISIGSSIQLVYKSKNG